MFLDDSQATHLDLDVEFEVMDEEMLEKNEQEQAESLTKCSQGHRSTVSLQTKQGGSICLFCLSNLITNPRAPTFHVSYALSHLSIALSHPPTLRSLLASHPLFLVSPLVRALSLFDDEPIARQIVQIVTSLCRSHNVRDEFVTRVADRLSAGSFPWNHRQAFMLHCFGVLLNCCAEVPYVQIKDKEALVSNLVGGLQFPSEEIRGEILFALHRLSILPNLCIEGDGVDFLFGFCPMLFRLSLDILMKTQNDTVRMNCIALLTILVRKGFLDTEFANDISSMRPDEADDIIQTTEPWLEALFADAVKGPLLSSDRQLQTNILDLIFHYLSRDETPTEIIQALVEENIVDYVFEVLRLSGYKDPLISSCILVLDRLSKAEKGFKERLVVGVSALVPALQFIAEVPSHPLQYQMLKLMRDAISDDSVLLLTIQVEELVLALTRMLKKYSNEEIGMSSETFIMVCSLFVALLESPSFDGSYNLITSVLEASSHAILSCLSISEKDSTQLLHALILLKEVYGYSQKEVFVDVSSIIELQHSIVDICTSHLLPWVIAAISDVDKEVVLELLEAFHFILLHDSDNHVTQFAQHLFSCSWFSLSFAFLGLFPTEKMKQNVYVVLSSLVDILFGNNSGQPISDSALSLPSDPTDLLFLLGQKSSKNTLLSSCQSATLLILHAGFLHNDRLADEKSVLASLEQYILVNCSDILLEMGIDSSIFIPLVNLYSISRFVAQMNGQINYSAEAERILFHLLSESEWNFPSSQLHVLSIKWLFQQEKVSKALSFQILKLCRSCSLDGTDFLALQESSQAVNMRFIAELATADDNYVARLSVCLLLNLVEESEELDIIPVIKFLTTMINFSPSSSDQLCIHGIGHAIKSCLNILSHSSPPEIFRASFLLIFKILCSVNHEALHDNEGWLGVTVKLVDSVSYNLTEKCWSDEAMLVIAIFSFILCHSTNGALLESSKVIIFNPLLASTINSLIQEFCTKGPGLCKYEMGSTGNSLILVLVLWYFSFKSLHVILPGHVDCKSLLETPITTRLLTMIHISCHDLCRLMHFGSSLVKLVASYSLLEIISRLSEQRENTNEEPSCLMDHLPSTMAVLEGLIFYSDKRVSMNCSRCLYMILQWDKLIKKDTRIAVHDTWFRLIIEEMVMSFAIPRMTSKSLINHHKPAIHILIALLKLQTPPSWMHTVFVEDNISSIIRNLAASDLSTEIVILFEELLNLGFLNTEQVDCLNRIFQEYRKLEYDVDDSRQEDLAKRVKTSDDLPEICEYLVHLVSSDACPKVDCPHLQFGKSRLLEEIDAFLRISAVEHIPE